jgi:hypothetical protein
MRRGSERNYSLASGMTLVAPDHHDRLVPSQSVPALDYIENTLSDPLGEIPRVDRRRDLAEA